MQCPAASSAGVRTGKDPDDIVLTGHQGLQGGQGCLRGSGEKHTHAAESKAPDRPVRGSAPARRGEQAQGDEFGPQPSYAGEAVGA